MMNPNTGDLSIPGTRIYYWKMKIKMEIKIIL